MKEYIQKTLDFICSQGKAHIDKNYGTFISGIIEYPALHILEDPSLLEYNFKRSLSIDRLIYEGRISQAIR